MNIVCIATAEIPSDTANSIQVMKTCQALGQVGHTVTLLVPGSQSHPWERLDAHYGLEALFPIQWLAANPRLRRYDFSIAAVRRAHKLHADLIYVWPLQAAVAGLLASLPVALELHGPPEGPFGPTLFRLFLRLSGRKRLLPITQALVKLLRPAFGPAVIGIDTVIAPNGVDGGRFELLPPPEDARKQRRLPERLTVGYTGHLYPGRGMDLLVELAARFPALQFLWVGGREADVDRWRQRLRQNQIDNITLTGFVPNRELPGYQAAMDILLMPYERVIEGSSGGNSADYCSPMKMFEYLAAGRAIISSDLPVLHEVLNDDLAVFCPPEELDPWAAALEELVLDPARRRALGDRARQAAAAYTWQARALTSLAGFPPRRDQAAGEPVSG
jgi:glycosyltransferase involved in cell wall biosynthesis